MALLVVQQQVHNPAEIRGRLLHILSPISWIKPSHCAWPQMQPAPGVRDAVKQRPQRNWSCRGRWDVIEAQVRLREGRMQAQMSEWMQQTRGELRAELEAQYQQTVKESAQECAGGASSAQQPELV